MRAQPSRALLALILAAGLSGLAGAAVAADAPAAAASAPVEAARPEFAKSFNTAQDLMKQNKAADAIAELKKAEALGNLSPYENYLLLRVRGPAEYAAGDLPAAAKDFEDALANERMPAVDKPIMMKALAEILYTDKHYPEAATWIQRYLDAGGTDPQVKELLAQTYYLAKDYPNAAKAFAAQVDATYKAGQAPTEKTLRLLASAQSQSGDDNGYAKTMERLAVAYPKGEHGRDYWGDVIQRASHGERLSDRVYVDVYRLKALAYGQVADSERLGYASLAMRAGYPSESKKLLDDGIGRKAFAGADAGEATKLRDQAARAAAADKAQAPANENAAKNAPAGDALVNLGLLTALDGDAAKGATLVDQGIAKGNFKSPDEARLHQGVVLVYAGRYADAQKAFEGVKGGGGIGGLAHAWSLYAQSQAGGAAMPVAAAASR